MLTTIVVLAMWAEMLPALTPKPMSPRGRRIRRVGGVRRAKTLDYRHARRNYGPSVAGWDDRVFIEMAHKDQVQARAYSKRDALDDIDYMDFCLEEEFVGQWGKGLQDYLIAYTTQR